MADALSVLARADAASKLPRLGGMARPNGVVVVSERFWAFAGVDGSLREGSMPAHRARFARVPLVRGLVRLGLALAPMFRRRGVVRPAERALLAAAVLAPLLLFLLPESLRLAAAVTVALATAVWLFRGRALHLHGAEHRAIGAAEKRSLVATWEGAARPSRFATRCGTNFAALVIPVALLADYVLFLPAVAVTLLSLALTMELWLAIEGSRRRVARAFLAPGLALQRVTTREPTLDETRIALRATASVLARELA